MIRHVDVTNMEILRRVKDQSILFAGNKDLKIYGHLYCGLGKRMKKANRVFFTSEEEALERGYRPCGNCLKTKFQQWKISCGR